MTQRENFPNVSSDCFIPFVLIIARCIMQVLAGAAFPMGWGRDELGLGFSPLGALGVGIWNSWLPQVWGWGLGLWLQWWSSAIWEQKTTTTKRDSAWKLPGILCVNLISKPFDPLFTYSAANPEKHPSPCLIWVKQLILLGVKYRCEALIQPSGNVMAWPEPRSPNYPRSKLTKSNHSGEKRSTTLPSDPSSWNSVTPVYSASVK